MYIRISKQVINNQELNSVNARKLHDFLSSKQQWADWIKNIISKYDCIDDEDSAVHKLMNYKVTQIDYIISLDNAR